MRQLEIDLIPILDDNYVFFIENKYSGKTALVDPGDAKPCLRSLQAKRKNLDFILITHHHADHIDGIDELKQLFPKVQIYAPLKNKSQIPQADFYLEAGGLVQLDGLGEFEIIGLPGHTLGHIGYYSKSESVLFSGDVLFGLSCGRIFEGTFEMTFEALQKIKKLPNETKVFCTHEYTMSNLMFVGELIETKQFSSGYDIRALEKYKITLLEKRSKNLPSVPLNLGDEKIANPMLFSSNVEDFARVRQLRDAFRVSKSHQT